MSSHEHSHHPVLGKFNENAAAIAQSIDARDAKLKALQALFEDSVRRNDNLVARNNELLGVLGDCYDYFESRADAEYFTDSSSPHPNEEMIILSRIKELGL